jgi:hypothetical protein
MNIKEKLEQLDACEDALQWVNNRTIEQAVADCHRGDWLLWLASKLGIDKRKLTLAKGHCANTVRHLMKEPLSIAAVDASIAYGEGKIGEEELKLARAGADEAACAAGSASAYAAWAYAAYSAVADWNAEADAEAASDAAASYAAAAEAAADVYAAAAAIKNNLKQTADICRKYIGDLIIQKFNKL